jgi:aryl-alcohol dehydrogenase-like predicted oxidoreductase
MATVPTHREARTSAGPEGASSSSPDPEAALASGHAADEEYDPKSKKSAERLTFCEKLFIASGSALFVLLLVLYRHPGIVSSHSPPDQPSHFAAAGGDAAGATEQKNGDKVLAALDLSSLTSGYMTSAGSEQFAALNRKNADHFGPVGGGALNFTLSTIGLGTYLGEISEETDAEMEDAVYQSVLQGVNVIDSSVNYRGMKSERAVGRALKRLFDENLVSREQLFISTKAGFIPSDSDRSISSRTIAAEWIADADRKSSHSIRKHIVGDKHCIAPACLERSLRLSQANLGLQTIDLFYLHNVVEKQLSVLGSKEQLLERLKSAFTWLESARERGFIKYYGLATWQCFRVAPSHPLYLSLDEVVKIAEAVGGARTHGFRFVQLPLTITMPEAFTQLYHHEDGSTASFLQYAEKRGIHVMTSRSVAAAKFDALAVVENVYHTCIPKGSKDDLSADPEPLLSLQIVRSIPGITTALVGMKKEDHIRSNLHLFSVSKIDTSVIDSCILREMMTLNDPALVDKNSVESRIEEQQAQQHKSRVRGKAKKPNARKKQQD